MHPRPWRDHLPAGSTFEVGDLTARRSLPRAWAETWARHPEAPVLLDGGASGVPGGSAAGVPGGPRWCVAGELDEKTRSCAEGLGRLGLAPGDRVLWSTASSLPAVIANIAALRAGLVVVPVNAAYTERELAHVVADVRPALAIIDDQARAEVLARADADLVVVTPDLEVVGGPERAAGHDAGGDAGSDGRPVAFGLDAAAPEDVALVAYTSGTTGAPKGAVLTHGNLLANSESIALTWRWSPEDRLVHALPIFHGHGLCVALYTSLLVGSSVVLLPRFDVDAVLDAATAHDATMFFGVPTMYHRLAASSRVGELGRLRLAVSGSAPLSAELHRAIAASARTEVLERYGMTETLMTLSNPYEGERRPGTVGFPFPGVEADVGDDGALLVRGPTVFSGYWERPAATAESFDDGWFRTGDLGVVEDGYVRLLGRSTELIISGGYNVYPAEVEDVLLGHPSVTEVAVTGAPSEEWGEVVCAWVVPDGVSPPDVESLLAYAAERLAPYKRPRQVHFVDALPRNSLGKVRRSELR